MPRSYSIERKTSETEIKITIDIDGSGENKISTGIPFFDHMLALFALHGFFNLFIDAKGDLEVDSHHTVEDVGIVLGTAINKALGQRKHIRRYGHAVVPMDEALTEVTVDFSNRPFLVYNLPEASFNDYKFNIHIAKEFFYAFSVNTRINLHINGIYGENEHHIVESVFKSLGRAVDQATLIDERILSYQSTKGII